SPGPWSTGFADPVGALCMRTVYSPALLVVERASRCRARGHLVQFRLVGPESFEFGEQRDDAVLEAVNVFAHRRCGGIGIARQQSFRDAAVLVQALAAVFDGCPLRELRSDEKQQVLDGREDVDEPLVARAQKDQLVELLVQSP